MRRIVLFMLLAVLTAMAHSARAHEFMPALLSIEGPADGGYNVSFKLPRVGAGPMALTAVFPGHCQKSRETMRGASGGYVRAYRMACERELAGETIRIEGLALTPTDVLVRVLDPAGSIQTSRVLASDPRVTIAAKPSAIDVAATYTILGTQHIMLGLDHVLFVLALLLLIERRSTLLWTITAFTAAHSITLALSALGLASVSPDAVEALVALSIVLLAAEVLKKIRSAPGQPSGHLSPPTVAFAFGLLHGLGFGGALKEIGLPAGEIPLALISFNVGVEIGQLLIVAVALLATAALRQLLTIRLSAARPAVAYGLGTIAAVWFIERMVDIALATSVS